MRALLVSSMLLCAGCPCGGMFGGGNCGPSQEIDTCSQVMAAAAQSLEIGHRGDPFRAYRDGEGADFEVGGQGLSMIGFRLRLVGVNDAECVAQETTTEVPNAGTDASVGRVTSQPLRFFKQSDGSRATGSVLLPAFVGGEFDLVAEAAGQTARVSLRR